MRSCAFKNLPHDVEVEALVQDQPVLWRVLFVSDDLEMGEMLRRIDFQHDLSGVISCDQADGWPM